MQWHVSRVSSGVGPPSDGPPTSPPSLTPTGGSKVSSLTSYHGVPPWPQLSQSARPSNDPLPSRHSSGWVQEAPATGDNATGDGELGDSPAGGGIG